MLQLYIGNKNYSSWSMRPWVLLRSAPAFVADAFCASRLAADRSLNYGALPRGVDAAAIIERATPRLS